MGINTITKRVMFAKINPSFSLVVMEKSRIRERGQFRMRMVAYIAITLI